MISQFDNLERSKLVELAEETLWQEDGLPGREYLLQTRQIREETARKFRLGYVPLSVGHQLGDRIIFPIFDSSNNLIALSSRLIHNNKCSMPTYWHERFNKSCYLYGLNIARDRIRQVGFTIVVEGNYDVLTCHDRGLTNVVGMLGNKITDFQLASILRYCENIIFIFDSDENQAGQKGAEKAAKNASKYEKKLINDYTSGLSLFNAGFVSLPEKDPDVFVRKHGIMPLKKLIQKKREKMCV